jgi:cytochrome c oxidase cbb3-type subunit IV
VIAMEAYKAAAEFAQTWGLGYFVIVFALVLLYALWPSRQQQFDHAARIPLQED